MPAVIDRHGHRAGFFGRDLALKPEIRGQIVDRAAHGRGSHRIGRRRVRASFEAAVRAVLDPVVALDTVAASGAAEGFRLGGDGCNASARLGMRLLVHDHPGDPGRGVIDGNGVAVVVPLQTGL